LLLKYPKAKDDGATDTPEAVDDAVDEIVEE
jgi:hypothetical protein